MLGSPPQLRRDENGLSFVIVAEGRAIAGRPTSPRHVPVNDATMHWAAPSPEALKIESLGGREQVLSNDFPAVHSNHCVLSLSIGQFFTHNLPRALLMCLYECCKNAIRVFEFVRFTWGPKVRK